MDAGAGRREATAHATAIGANATAIDVYRAAASGDPLATEIADAVGRRLAWAVHLLVMTYDVERVVLGGGVSHAGETFMLPIQRELDRMRAASALARESCRRTSSSCCRPVPMPGHGAQWSSRPPPMPGSEPVMDGRRWATYGTRERSIA